MTLLRTAPDIQAGTRVVCPHCERARPVNSSGRVRKHRNQMTGSTCRGSGLSESTMERTPSFVIAKVTEQCTSHPEGGTHECMSAEMRCAYCGARLAPYPCNGCGKFMTADEMYSNGGDGIWRCGECT